MDTNTNTQATTNNEVAKKEESQELQALKAAHKALVDSVIAKVISDSVKVFGGAMSNDAALEVAKSLGFVIGVKGKGGGYRATGTAKVEGKELIAKGDSFLGEASKAMVSAINKAEEDYEASLAAGPESLTEAARKLGVQVKGKRVKAEDLLMALKALQAKQAQEVQEAPKKAPVVRKH
jgi:hypothetical protein